MRRAVAMKRGLELAAVRHVPVVDPDTGRITSFDTMMRKMAKESGMDGSLGEDPVGASYMMMVDSNYLFNSARIVQNPDGEYVTLDEALSTLSSMPTAFDRSAVEKASACHVRMQTASRRGDAAALSNASEEFATAVAKANRSAASRHTSPGLAAYRHTSPGSTSSGHRSPGSAASGRTSLGGEVASLYEDYHGSLAQVYRRELGADREQGWWWATITLAAGGVAIIAVLGAIVWAGIRRYRNRHVASETT
ncbi:MAG: hypothetical protein ACYTKD_24215 [Planctomycetota bacterium]|jgi:hypothetical protein